MTDVADGSRRRRRRCRRSRCRRRLRGRPPRRGSGTPRPRDRVSSRPTTCALPRRRSPAGSSDPSRSRRSRRRRDRARSRRAPRARAGRPPSRAAGDEPFRRQVVLLVRRDQRLRGHAVDRLLHAIRVDVRGRVDVRPRVLAHRQPLDEVAVLRMVARLAVDLERRMRRPARHPDPDRRRDVVERRPREESGQRLEISRHCHRL